MTKMLVMKCALILFLIGSLGMGMVVQAQDQTQVELIFPPSVYTVSGSVEIVGTVGGDAIAFSIELQPLGLDLLPLNPNSTIWFPLNIAAVPPVTEAILGYWDTTLLPDGLYALRIQALNAQQMPIHAVVSPVRVQNTSATPPVAPLTTSTAGTPLTVRAVSEANVRAGDGVVFDVIGKLPLGSQAIVLGQSNRSTWYQIQLSDGTQGYVASSAVRLNGDLSTLILVTPPAFP